MLSRRLLPVAAFFAAAYAQGQLAITTPSPTSWWVAGSFNTLAWTCDTSPYSAYTAVLSNTDTSILSAPLALIASVPNYDCSFTVNSQLSSQAVSSSWVISLANPLNQSDIYASTQFEIKADGSPYPTSTSSGTVTSSGGTASSTSTSKTGAASSNHIPAGISMVVALVLGLVA